MSVIWKTQIALKENCIEMDWTQWVTHTFDTTQFPIIQNSTSSIFLVLYQCTEPNPNATMFVLHLVCVMSSIIVDCACFLSTCVFYWIRQLSIEWNQSWLVIMFDVRVERTCQTIIRAMRTNERIKIYWSDEGPNEQTFGASSGYILVLGYYEIGLKYCLGVWSRRFMNRIFFFQVREM